MRLTLNTLFFAIFACLLLASQAKATNYVYGYTSIYADPSSGLVSGYHRTEVDYDTEVYYTPRVCGSLYKDDIEQVRSCHTGIIAATSNTQTSYSSGSTYSALSDHYVDIQYEEEDPNNPGYYYYPDPLGYTFSNGGSQPIDWYYLASGIYYQRPDESIRLGDTHVEIAPRNHLYVVSDSWGWVYGCPSQGPVFRAIGFRVVDSNNVSLGAVPVTEQFLRLSTNTCGNGQPQSSSCSNTDSNGEFTDYVSVNCNGIGGDCGYNITWEWQVCPFLTMPTHLGTLVGRVRHSQVTVNGTTSPPYGLTGKHIY
jgi:hypothetical protein